MVFDTMIVAYALLNVKDVNQFALNCLKSAKNIYAPELLRSELTNVMWQYIRHEDCSFDNAQAIFSQVDQIIEWIPVNYIWGHALELSIKYNHSPYDTLFIASAFLKKTKLITRDKTLLKLFPKITVTMEEYLR